MAQAEKSALWSDAAVVILCGGKGTRMGSDTRHKVCFPIDGVPAIIRTVRMFEAYGLKRIVIVVGALAGDVVTTVGQEFPNVVFVYQSQQRGTGHAARIGVNALNNLGFKGPVLITMGDKVLEPIVLDQMAELFVRRRADMVFVTGPRQQNPGAGRIVTDKSGKVLGNIEQRDIQLAQIYAGLMKLAKAGKAASIRYEQVIDLGLKFIPNEKKLIKALGGWIDEVKKAGQISGRELLTKLGENGGLIRLGKNSYTAEELEKAAKTVNLSVYLGDSEFWYRTLPTLSNDNAQGEYYLPDVITLGGTSDEWAWKMQQYEITDPSLVMAFNSPDELLIIEDTLRRKNIKAQLVNQPSSQPGSAQAVLSGREFRKAGRWLEMFETWPAKLANRFTEIYGPDKAIHQARRKIFINALKLFIKRYGADRRVIVVRAPGRINLLGRHVDHRGGAVNVLAIDRDVVFVAAPRTDDVVRLANVDSVRHPDREFSIGQMLGQIEWGDWLSFVNSDYVRRMIAQTRGDWSNYIKASLLRLQQNFRQVRLLGFDTAVCGDIPQAAGLSSSSALVVASAEVARILNGLDVEAGELVDLCGQGEWFVGSRGGSADHAAIRMGKRGQIAHVKFFPFQIDGTYSFPDSCRLVIANSGIDAHKSSTAKDKFNQKVASYEFGFMLLRERNKEVAHLLEHLRDINPRRLNCLVSQIYKLLLSIPQELAANTLRDVLGGSYRDQVDRILSSHEMPEKYDLRNVVLYGMAECERSLLAPKLLSENQPETFGQLMGISHDGDRVSKHVKNGKASWLMRDYQFDISDAAIHRLCQDLTSEDPRRVLEAQLYMQAGGYGCSTRQIDKMVDIVRDVPGCYGAQLGGAGLGGCIMILVRADACDRVIEALKTDYYRPAKVNPMLHACQPVEGSGMICV
ncbi:MAG: NTP transferase domain-containing protein [Phycisphaerae bacterium]|nr:NTP transferase domain-containing protein [Phycisphaerae bacterium]